MKQISSDSLNKKYPLIQENFRYMEKDLRPPWVGLSCRSLFDDSFKFKLVCFSNK